MTRHIQSAAFFLAVLLLSWLPASAFATESISTNQAFGSFMVNVVGGNQQSVNFGSNGQAVLSTASGNLQAQASGTVQVAGRPLTVTATARPSMSKIASGILKYATAISGPILLGSALYDLFQYAGGYFADHNIDGSLKVTKISVSYSCSEGDYVNGQCMRTLSLCVGGWWSAAVAQSKDAGCMNHVRGASGVDYYKVSTGEWWAYYPYSPTSVTATQSGTVVDVPESELLNAIANDSGWPSTDVLTKAVAQAASYIEPATFQQQKTLTGPSTLQGTTTTTVNVDNSTTTKTEVHNVTYEGDKVTFSTVTTSTTVMPDGTTKSETSTQTNTAEPVSIETCGLPGKPVCNVKVDETGTKTKVPETEFISKADSLRAPQEAALNEMKTTGSSFFAGFSNFFSAPALVSCEPIQLPERGGVSMGSLDPCPVVNGMRSVMAYIWAIAGLFLCIGMVRQTVQGG